VRRLTNWGVVLLVTFSAACSEEPVGPPPPPFAIAISVAVHSAALNSESGEYECRYTFTARATGGTTGTYANWQSGEGQWRYPAGGSSTFFLDNLDLVDYFGSNRISTGATQTAPRIASYSGEFDLSYTFRASMPDSTLSSTSVFVDCY